MAQKANGAPRKAVPKAAGRQGKTPEGNSWAQVEAAAKKLGGARASGPDNTMAADVAIARAKKAGKSDAEIAKMSGAQLKKFF